MTCAVRPPKQPGALFDARMACRRPYRHRLLGLRVSNLGLSFYTYNEVAFYTLDAVHPITHAVGNTIKRVILILFSVLRFGTPMTTQARATASRPPSPHPCSNTAAAHLVRRRRAPSARPSPSRASSPTRWPRTSSSRPSPLPRRPRRETKFSPRAAAAANTTYAAPSGARLLLTTDETREVCTKSCHERLL